MGTQTQYGHTETGMISRFSIAILGCTNIGYAIGNTFTIGFTKQAFIAGGIALLFYFYESVRDKKLRREQSDTCRRIAEMRLEQQSAEHFRRHRQHAKKAIYKSVQ